jgi:hypothetical protein
VRLMRQLAGLRQGRLDMERFVREFNGAVMRAENGITALRQAARDSGDDLEKLVEKAGLLRDELQFIVASADQIASRLSRDAANAASAAETPADKAPEVRSATVESIHPRAQRKQEPASAAASSRAEKELMQALEKLG